MVVTREDFGLPKDMLFLWVYIKALASGHNFVRVDFLMDPLPF